MKLLGLGDNVMDAYLFRGELYPGGNAANVAVLAKRAGAEKSGYIGVLATDAAGEHFLPCRIAGGKCGHFTPAPGRRSYSLQLHYTG